MSESRERFEEAIGMIRRMWTEERVSQKAVSGHGRRQAHAARGAEAAPAGLDRGDLDRGIFSLRGAQRFNSI